MRKVSTLNDLHRLVSRLIKEGHGNAHVGMAMEYTSYLDKYGEVEHTLDKSARDTIEYFDLG